MKKSAIKTVKDIMTGSIVRTEKGNEYVVLRDDRGEAFMLSKKGTWVRLNQDALTSAKGTYKIEQVSIFASMPQADQISEAIKYLYTGREACADLVVIYKAENPEITARKQKIEDINSIVSGLLSEIEDLKYEIAELSDEDNDDYDDDYDADEEEY